MLRFEAALRVFRKHGGIRVPRVGARDEGRSDVRVSVTATYNRAPSR